MTAIRASHTLFILPLAITALTYADPTTKPADRSSPDKTWAAVCDAIKAGDLPSFRACYYNKNEISKMFMESWSDMTVTAFQLAFATALLGDEGKQISDRLSATYSDAIENGRNRKTEITGDTARWIRTEKTDAGVIREEVMYFKKVNGEWLIDTNQSYALDTAAGRKEAEGFIASADAQLKTLKGVIDDIHTKKITTVDQMRTRMAEK